MSFVIRLTLIIIVKPIKMMLKNNGIYCEARYCKIAQDAAVVLDLIRFAHDCGNDLQVYIKKNLTESWPLQSSR